MLSFFAAVFRGSLAAVRLFRRLVSLPRRALHQAAQALEFVTAPGAAVAVVLEDDFYDNFLAVLFLAWVLAAGCFLLGYKCAQWRLGRAPAPLRVEVTKLDVAPRSLRSASPGLLAPQSPLQHVRGRPLKRSLTSPPTPRLRSLDFNSPNFPAPLAAPSARGGQRPQLAK